MLNQSCSEMGFFAEIKLIIQNANIIVKEYICVILQCFTTLREDKECLVKIPISSYIMLLSLISKGNKGSLVVVYVQ